MASIKPRRDGWFVRVRLPYEPWETSKQFDRKVDAQAWAALTEASILKGDNPNPRNQKVTFAEYAEAYRTSRSHRGGTADSLEQMLRLHAVPKWGTRAIGSIRRTEVQAWAASLTETMAASTAKLLFVHTRAVFNAAVADEVISRSPFFKVPPPKVTKRPVVPFTDAEVTALLAAATDRWRGLYLLALATGIRSGEALGLVAGKGSLDLTARTVRIDRQAIDVTKSHRRVIDVDSHAEVPLRIVQGDPVYRQRGTSRGWGPPKTDASHRTVSIDEDVALELAGYCAAAGIGAGDLMFPDSNGRISARATVTQGWHKAIERAGVERPEAGGSRFHDCRHTYASALLSDGVSVAAVAALLGHGDPAVTLRIYAHVIPNDDLRAAAAMQKASAAWLCRGPAADRTPLKAL